MNKYTSLFHFFKALKFDFLIFRTFGLLDQSFGIMSTDPIPASLTIALPDINSLDIKEGFPREQHEFGSLPIGQTIY